MRELLFLNRDVSSVTNRVWVVVMENLEKSWKNSHGIKGMEKT